MQLDNSVIGSQSAAVLLWHCCCCRGSGLTACCFGFASSWLVAVGRVHLPERGWVGSGLPAAHHHPKMAACLLMRRMILFR